MKREIPKTNDYTDISVLDFPYREFHDEELELVKKLVRKMIHAKTDVSCIAFLFGLLFIYLLINNIDVLDSKEIIFHIVSSLLLFFIGIHIMKTGFLPKPTRKMKALYGQVNGIWALNKGKDRYLDVIFPDTKTRYRKVPCLFKDFKKAEKGDCVLVIALHNKKICGFIIQDKYKIYAINKNIDFMKQEMSKANACTDISVSSFPQKEFCDNEFKIVKNFVKKMKYEKIKESSFPFIFSFIFLYLFIRNIEILKISDYFFMIGTIALSFLIGFYILKGGLLPKPANTMKAQYGQVYSAPPLEGGQNHYLDVIFPETSSRYRKVQCLHKDYMKAEKGDKILVIAFHDKKVCGFIIHDKL